MGRASGKLLLIEDDAAVRLSLEQLIRELGFELHAVGDGESGLAAAVAEPFDFVILDVGLPGINGIEVCRQLRQRFPSLPIMLLSGRADELHKVIGLEVGADDYVSKPFSTVEVGARVKAICRRAFPPAGSAAAIPPTPVPSAPPAAALLIVGDLSIDFERRRVLKRGQQVDLTRMEFDLLEYLAMRPGVPKRREELMEDVWGFQCADYDNAITTYVSRLRQKIEDSAARPKYLLTARGIGYAFVHPDELKAGAN